MRICSILFPVITAGSAIALAASAGSTTRVMMIVRIDARTGRLLRAVAPPPRQSPAKISRTTASAPEITLPPAPDPAPSAMRNMVDQIAQRHEVDRDLVHSVIRIESNYNPYAISEKGALGLMQLDPSTARRFGVSNAMNPAQNVDGGVRYLKYLLEHYKGDRHLALAAYNAGEGSVERFGGVPPYPETRNYVYQVGKKLDEAQEARKNASPPANKSLTSDGHNRIHAFVDATGRISYRTP
ncbi:MAG: hypothetical protein DMG57_27660 [Acidobacteria bacterium]|nr:MAG: hypothetical protein DMG57_27660 [Acidobacteriota bacterium]